MNSDELGIRKPAADPAAPPPPRLLTPEEAAKWLGIGLTTLRELKARGEIAFIEIGRRPRYSVDDLKAFIDARRKNAGGVPSA